MKYFYRFFLVVNLITLSIILHDATVSNPNIPPRGYALWFAYTFVTLVMNLLDIE